MVDININEEFIGSHGILEGGSEHGKTKYKVTGIMKPTGTVLDRLILTSLNSVQIHGLEDIDHQNKQYHNNEKNHDHQQEDVGHQKEDHHDNEKDHDHEHEDVNHKEQNHDPKDTNHHSKESHDDHDDHNELENLK